MPHSPDHDDRDRDRDRDRNHGARDRHLRDFARCIGDASGGSYGLDLAADAPTSRSRRALLGAASAGGLAALLGCAHQRPPPTYRARRAAYATKLQSGGPSPGKWREQPPPAGAAAIRYPSPAGELLAWFARPPDARGEVPALVFFHGEFSLARADFEAVRPFVAAGFAVMTPALRGENGNPGDFELLWGEVNDARAAITWLSGQPGIDRDRIFTLGHSIGGGLSALLAFHGELPLRATASAAGIYVPETFVRWAQQPGQRELIRFDPGIADERELRALGPHVGELAHRHLAYVGVDDRPITRNARAVAALAAGKTDRYQVIEVPGDHGTMLREAVARYLDFARGDGS